MKKRINNKAIMALSQIFILVIGTFAFAYIIGSEFRVVSASDTGGGDGDCNVITGTVDGYSYIGTFEYDGDTYYILSENKIYGKGCEVGVGCENRIFNKIGGKWCWEGSSGICVSTTSEPTFYSSSADCISEITSKQTLTGDSGSSCGGGQGTCMQWATENEGTSNQKRTCPSGFAPVSSSDIFLDCDSSQELVCCKAGSTTDTTKEDEDTTMDCYSKCRSLTYADGGCSSSCYDGRTVGSTAYCEEGEVCCCYYLNPTSSEDETTDPLAVLPTAATAATGLLNKIPSKEEPENLIDEQNLDETADVVDKPFGWEWDKHPNAAYWVGGMVKGLMWAAGIAGGIQLLKAFLPERSYRLLNSLTVSLAVGAFVGRTTAGIVQATSEGTKKGIGLGIGIGIAVSAIIFFAMYRKESQEIITFTCHPWQAPTGGDNCDECNDEVLPCSEYQCRSLGQACELVNPGTDEEKCVWVNKNDVEFPIIQPWEDVLLNDYVYSPDNAISPPDTGVRIEYTESTSGLSKAFSPVTFGITLNEPAKCKLDLSRKDNFDDMNFYFSGGLLLEEHEYTLSAPGTSALEAEGIELENDGEYEIYVRCEDANGNSNKANFVFLLGVEQGPDTTPPLIVTTDPLNDHPFAYNQSSIDMSIYVNEPVDGCRWSHVDQNYEDMENNMDCANANNLADMDARGYYSCDATLSGLNDGVENKFYFKCMDLAENANLESYEYTLIGTQPLVIDWVGPNGTIKDSTDSVKVTLEARTSAGYNEGEASCYYKNSSQNTEDYVLFYNTNTYEHSQDLWLSEGPYSYDIRCVDLGGNADVETVNFEVDSDSNAPIIVRAYHEETYLKLVTNEDARCVYDTTYEDYPCDYSYDDGIPFTTIEDIYHYTDWNPDLTFYIICEDTYGNQPAPDTCSQIIRPSDIH